MYVDGQVVVERETSVSGDVIGMRVRLEHADETDTTMLDLCQQRLDRVRRVDDDCNTLVLVADEVRRAAQVVVHELREDHARDGSSESRYLS
jgi:hypothetical protein